MAVAIKEWERGASVSAVSWSLTLPSRELENSPGSSLYDGNSWFGGGTIPIGHLLRAMLVGC